MPKIYSVHIEEIIFIFLQNKIQIGRQKRSGEKVFDFQYKFFVARSLSKPTLSIKNDTRSLKMIKKNIVNAKPKNVDENFCSIELFQLNFKERFYSENISIKSKSLRLASIV